MLGEGYAGVCLKVWQFSCSNKNDPNYTYLSDAKPIALREVAEVHIVADQVMAGKVPDLTGGRRSPTRPPCRRLLCGRRRPSGHRSSVGTFFSRMCGDSFGVAHR